MGFEEGVGVLWKKVEENCRHRELHEPSPGACYPRSAFTGRGGSTPSGLGEWTLGAGTALKNKIVLVTHT